MSLGSEKTDAPADTIDDDKASSMDPVIMPFVHAHDVQEEDELDALVRLAAPIIRQVTRWTRASDDAYQEAMRLVVEKLRRLKSHSSERPVGHFGHYVAVVASHVVKATERVEQPDRRRLQDALRYALKHEPSLAMWRVNGESMCGLIEWADKMPCRRSERLTRLLNETSEVASLLWPMTNWRHLGVELIAADVLRWLGHPMRCRDLGSVLMYVKAVERQIRVVNAEDDDGPGPEERLPDCRRLPDAQVAWREFLTRLWSEIRQLPPLQRIAYLLNFSAADGALDLFWIYDVASLREVGRAVELTPEQLTRLWAALEFGEAERGTLTELSSYDERFAFLSRYLPLRDDVIAGGLGTTRQKVINLRKAAGARLSRRLAPPAARAR